MSHDEGTPHVVDPVTGEATPLREWVRGSEEERSEVLMTILRDAGTEWGPMGVALAAAELTDIDTLIRHLQGMYQEPRIIEPEISPDERGSRRFRMFRVFQGWKIVYDGIDLTDHVLGWSVKPWDEDNPAMPAAVHLTIMPSQIDIDQADLADGDSDD